jgi:alkylation response protein AidB-like acyl-CoA dehydrogenase
MSGIDAASWDAFGESVARYVDTKYDFDTYRRFRATPEGFGRAAWGDYADLGWLGLAVPEEAGGLGGGAQAMAVLMEGVGRGLLLEPFLASLVLGAGLVAAVADAVQAAVILPGIVSGETILAFAHDEGAQRSGFAHHQCRAIPTPTGFRLRGGKSLVLHGDVATALIVSARIEGDAALSLFLLDAKAPGLVIERHRLIDGRGFARIHLNDAPAERLGAGPAEPAIRTVVERAVAAVCAEGVGAMARLNAMTLDYVKTREQFGQKIAGFQAIQHRLVDMAVAEREARSIAAAAACALDARHTRAGLVVSAAKIRVNRAARFIGENAVQLHGAIGMTEELPVGHFFKRLLVIVSLFGDDDAHLDRPGPGPA